MKQSQLERVKKRLLATGSISRNDCLRNYISRLSAIILKLKEQGFEFETEEKDNDYIYRLKSSPMKKVVYRVPSLGKEIISYK